jgi:hypothetical protein
MLEDAVQKRVLPLHPQVAERHPGTKTSAGPSPATVKARLTLSALRAWLMQGTVLTGRLYLPE